MGLYDVGAKALAPEYAADLVKRRDYNPISAGIGEAAGVIGSAVLTGGGSLEAEGASALARAAAATPAARAMMFAEGAAAWAARQGISRTGQLAVSGAVEGALFGASKAVADDYLRDHEITVERMAMGAGLGAVMGGGFGLALGGAQSAVGAIGGLGQRAVSGLMGRLSGRGGQALESELASSVRIGDQMALGAGAAGRAEAGSAAGALGRSEVDATGQGLARSSTSVDLADDITARAGDDLTAELTLGGDRKPTGALERFAEGATARERFAEMRDRAVKEITDAGSHNARIFDDAIAYSNVGLKPAAAKNALMSAPPREIAAANDALLNETVAIRDRLWTHYLDAQQGGFREGGARAIRRMVKELDGFEKEVTNGLAMGEADGTAHALIAFDKFKRRIGQVQDTAAKGIDGDPAAQAVLRNEYMAVRNFLEDGSKLGEGWASLQRDVNKGWTEYLDLAPAYEQRFALSRSLRTTRSERDGFVRVPDADASKVQGALNAIGSPGNMQAEDVLVRTPQLQAQLLQKLSKYYDLEGAHVAEVAAMAQNAKRIADTVAELRRLKVVGDQFDEAVKALSDVPLIGANLAKMKITAGRTLDLSTRRKGTLSSSVEADVNTATRAVTEARTSSEAGAITEASAEVQARRAAEAEAVHRASVRAADAAETAVDNASTRIARGPGPRRRSSGVASAMNVLGVEYAVNKSGAAAALSSHLAAFLDPNSDERQKARAKLYRLREASPEMADALEQQAVRAATFLREKAGPSEVEKNPSDPFAHLRPAADNSRTALRLGRYIRATKQPGDAVGRIADGTFTREDVETLQRVYPRMYQRLVAQVTVKLSDAKKRPTREQQRVLGELVPAAVPSRAPAYVARMQQLIKSAPTAAVLQNDRQQMSRGKSPDIAGLYSTRDTRREMGDDR
jgi:hypothetical protein